MSTHFSQLRRVTLLTECNIANKATIVILCLHNCTYAIKNASWARYTLSSICSHAHSPQPQNQFEPNLERWYSEPEFPQSSSYLKTLPISTISSLPPRSQVRFMPSPFCFLHPFIDGNVYCRKRWLFQNVIFAGHVCSAIYSLCTNHQDCPTFLYSVPSINNCTSKNYCWK